MSLPEYVQVRYSRPPVRLVVCQMRFPSLLRIADRTFVADFQEEIGGDYPNLRYEEQVQFQVSSKGMTENSHVKLYRFSDQIGAWSVLLGEDSLTLEARAYSSVEDLLRRFEQVTVAAQQTLGIQTRQRLGLRYVNEFRRLGAAQLSDWVGLFRPEFLGFASVLFEEPVTYTVQQVKVDRPDGMFVVRHGLVPGTTVPPMAAVSNPTDRGLVEPFYLLDLDYADARSIPLDVASSLEQLRAYNGFVYRFFRWTLSEDHHSALEPQNVRPA